MKILHIFDHSIPLHSGYTFRSRAILTHQRAMGWDTYHLTSPKHNLATRVDGDEEHVEGLHFYRTAVPRGVSTKLPVVGQSALVSATTKRLTDVTNKVKPDILHAHSPVLNAIPALRVGRRLGIPVVYEIRAFWEDAAVDHGTSREGGVRYRLSRALETYAIRHVQAITTICDGLRGDIVARGVAEDNVIVIPNAVDLGQFSLGETPDEALQRRLGLKHNHVLGFIGSFYAYEGLAVLLRALPRILSEMSNTCVLLVGGGPQEEPLKQLARDLGIAKHVIFTGRVPHDEVHRYYDLIDVLVYPRLSMRLTELVTPLKPLEAMAQGRLVLASDVGGHRELIRNDETGRLFAAGDADALVAAAVDLLRGRDHWPTIKAAGRRFVEQERNWVESVERYRPLYERLTQSNSVGMASVP